MSLIKKLATAGAVAAMGLGLGAASASASVTLSPSNTNFTGHNTGAHTFDAGGVTVSCDTATFAGNTGSGARSTIPFHADYSSCSLIVGGIPYDAAVTTNSNWAFHNITKPSASWTSDVEILAPGSGNAVVIEVPDFDCEIYVNAQSGLGSVTASNTSPTGVAISAAVTGISWTQNGNCPLDSSGNDGEYDGAVDIPGVTMS